MNPLIKAALDKVASDTARGIAKLARLPLCSWCDSPATHSMLEHDHMDYGCEYHTARWTPTGAYALKRLREYPKGWEIAND